MTRKVAERLIAEDMVLGFPRHVTFRHDDVRGRWVILAPERLLLPDDTAIENLQRLDGKRSVATIIDMLAVEFNAPRTDIALDVLEMLQGPVDERNGFAMNAITTKVEPPVAPFWPRSRIAAPCAACTAPIPWNWSAPPRNWTPRPGST